MDLKVDLEWGDEGVIPETIHPDTAFIFEKMGDVIQEMVAPDPGSSKTGCHGNRSRPVGKDDKGSQKPY